MKLSELARFIQYTTVIEDNNICLTITESNLNENRVLDISFGSTPKQSTKSVMAAVGKEAWNFFKNPIVAGLTVGWALNKLDDYNRTKRDTIKFYAKTGEEKVFYKKMVDEMLSTGKYTLINSKNVSGAYSWTLKRKWGA